ncbi:MAG TPA: hypothetical protein PLD25_30235 [Chloroflexota bacterium]|nr:hypothetical protein [Chloroflexota bacterium]HUM68104.1 hypothetical protein [Chloroflexota bacterium]
MKKKQLLLGLCLWLLFNGCATLIRFWAQAMSLYPDPAVNPMTAAILPAVAGLIISRWIPFKTCVLLAVMSFTSLLFSMWLAAVLLPINGVIAYWLAGEMLAGNITKNTQR